VPPFYCKQPEQEYNAMVDFANCVMLLKAMDFPIPEFDFTE
jgi:hypothetical protein